MYLSSLDKTKTVEYNIDDIDRTICYYLKLNRQLPQTQNKTFVYSYDNEVLVKQ